MKKKILILMILSLLFTGCSAKYDLVINGDSYKETLTGYFPKEDFNYNIVKGMSKQKIPISQIQGEDKFYSSSDDEDSSNYIVSKNYKHSLNTIGNSYFITRCYGKDTIKKYSDEIIIDTDNEFQCILLEDGAKVDEVIINITTKMKVLKNNADKVNGNTYTWVVNESNYKNKPIYLEMKQSFNNLGGTLQLALLVIFIFTIMLIVFGLIKNKKNKNNSF